MLASGVEATSKPACVDLLLALAVSTVTNPQSRVDLAGGSIKTQKPSPRLGWLEAGGGFWELEFISNDLKSIYQAYRESG